MNLINDDICLLNSFMQHKNSPALAHSCARTEARRMMTVDFFLSSPARTETLRCVLKHLVQPPHWCRPQCAENEAFRRTECGRLHDDWTSVHLFLQERCLQTQMLQQNRQITRNSSMMQIRPTGSCCRISAQAWSRSPLSCVSKSMSESIRNGSYTSPVEAAGRASREPLTGNSLSRAPSSGIPALGKAQRRRGLVVINSGAAGGMAHGSGGRGAKVGLAHHVLITLSWVTSDQHFSLVASTSRWKRGR